MANLERRDQYPPIGISIRISDPDSELIQEFKGYKIFKTTKAEDAKFGGSQYSVRLKAEDEEGVLYMGNQRADKKDPSFYCGQWDSSGGLGEFLISVNKFYSSLGLKSPYTLTAFSDKENHPPYY